MTKLGLVLGGMVALTAQVGCADNATSTGPSRSAQSAAANANTRSSDRVVSILDACDGPTFEARGIGCSRSHGVTLQQFNAELTANGSVGAWHFAPSNSRVSAQSFE